MERNIEALLDLCIEEMKRGKSLEACLANYPEHADQLAPLLRLAQEIDNLPLPVALPEAMSATLFNLGTRFGVSERKKGALALSRVLQARRSWAFGAVSFLLILLFGGATISTKSIPGDILYPAKLATEKVVFFFSFNAEEKVELRLRFSYERLKEMVQIFEQSGTLDKELLKSMLDEAKLALEHGNQLSGLQASLFQVKFNHANAYQKESLEHIRIAVPPSELKTVDRAIEVCTNRMQWMMKRMKEGRHVPWTRGCDMW